MLPSSRSEDEWTVDSGLSLAAVFSFFSYGSGDLENTAARGVFFQKRENVLGLVGADALC